MLFNYLTNVIDIFGKQNTPIPVLNDFFQLIYPRHCLVCQNTLLKAENSICLPCEYNLPRHDNFHDSELLKKFLLGRFKAEYVFSFLKFEKGGTAQKLIYQLKYRGNKNIGYQCGKWLGKEIASTEDHAAFDFIIPVPLHYKKLRRRGYNQSELFGNGLSESLGVKMNSNCLIKVNDGESQTNKNRYDRWMNISRSFKLKSQKQLINKHLLLVDDVLTTGSTVEAAARTLLRMKGVRVSIATIAYTT